jgi:hypothetical protein
MSCTFNILYVLRSGNKISTPKNAGDTKRLEGTHFLRRSTGAGAAVEKLKKPTCLLQKVVWGLARHVRLNLPRSWVELEEVLIHVLTDFEDGSHVPTSVAVVWRAEHCHNILILHHTIQNKLKILIHLSSSGLPKPVMEGETHNSHNR